MEDGSDLDLGGTESGEVHAAPNSALSGLRARRAKAVEALFHDLKVPRYDPPMFVRFKPVTQARIDAANKRHEHSKDRDKAVLANCEVLAEACIGIFELDENHQPVSVDPENRSADPGQWPRFDKRLFDLFEFEGTAPEKAAAIVRLVYLTDGDVIAVASDLAEWSGFAAQDLERDDPGN